MCMCVCALSVYEASNESLQPKERRMKHALYFSRLVHRVWLFIPQSSSIIESSSYATSLRFTVLLQLLVLMPPQFFSLLFSRLLRPVVLSIWLWVQQQKRRGDRSANLFLPQNSIDAVPSWTCRSFSTASTF